MGIDVWHALFLRHRLCWMKLYRLASSLIESDLAFSPEMKEMQASYFTKEQIDNVVSRYVTFKLKARFPLKGAIILIHLTFFLQLQTYSHFRRG